MWTMQKDFKYSMIQAEAKKPAISRVSSISPKKGFFRSNSYDKRQRISAITELENAQAEEKEI